MSATEASASSSTCYELGKDGLASWPEPHASAWIGLLEAHKHLTRELDAELGAEHGLTLSALEALSRLASADRRAVRLSDLAAGCGLSLSRISRIIDSLEARGLVERRGVQSDGRAVEAHLTDAGLQLVCRAQATHFASLQHMFFERLTEPETALLAEIFSRFGFPRSGCGTGRSPYQRG